MIGIDVLISVTSDGYGPQNYRVPPEESLIVIVMHWNKFLSNLTTSLM